MEILEQKKNGTHTKNRPRRKRSTSLFAWSWPACEKLSPSCSAGGKLVVGRSSTKKCCGEVVFPKTRFTNVSCVLANHQNSPRRLLQQVFYPYTESLKHAEKKKEKKTRAMNAIEEEKVPELSRTCLGSRSQNYSSLMTTLMRHTRFL